MNPVYSPYLQHSTPIVSVVMPVYNGEAYLCEAIDSILCQTFKNFEFIIVDDGSTDSTWHILTNYAAHDHRIKLLRNSINLRLIRTLNRGVSLAQGKYIARMDADDISLPTRLEAQVNFLEGTPEVGIVGTAYVRIYPDGSTSVRRPPLTDTAIRWRLLFGNIWCHPSMMFRRSLVELEQPFYRDFLHAEDYELWTRLIKHTRAATLPTPLVHYRMHSNSICATYNEPQEQIVSTISQEQINALLPQKLTALEILELRASLFPQHRITQAMQVYQSMHYLFESFGRQQEVDANVVHQLRHQWFTRFLAAVPFRQISLLLASNLLNSTIQRDLFAVLIDKFFQIPQHLLNRFYRSCPIQHYEERVRV